MGVVYFIGAFGVAVVACAPVFGVHFLKQTEHSVPDGSAL